MVPVTCQAGLQLVVSSLIARLVFKDQTSEIYFPGNISKNCTSDGWSETFPDFIDACGYSDPEDERKVGARRPHTLHPHTLQTHSPLWGSSLLNSAASPSALNREYAVPFGIC